MKSRIWRILALITVLCILLSGLTSCSDDSENLPFSSEENAKAELRIGVLGESEKITFGEELYGSGNSTVGKGFECRKGELKPLWMTVSDAISVDICEVSASEKLDNCDLVIGSAYELDRLAREGLLLDLSSLFANIPNLKASLYSDELIFSYLGKTKYGEAGLYSVPTRYEIPRPELSAFLNEDMVRLLLDEDFEGSDKPFGPVLLESYMPKDGAVTVDIISPEGELGRITKNYTNFGNIIEAYKMHKVGKLTGKVAIQTLRKYIDEVYGGRYGARRSELFLGNCAAYDADELAALLICAAANSELLCEGGNMACAVAGRDDAIAMLATLYGVRGLGAGGYSYVDADGTLVDCRTESYSYELLDTIHSWIETGILTLTEDGTPEDTDFAASFGRVAAEDKLVEILPPVARWYDGTNQDEFGHDSGSYFRFSESVSRTSDLAIGISKKGTVSSQSRLLAAIKLLEFAFTDEGKKIFLCEEEKEEILRMADALGYTRAEDYARDFLGAGVAFYSPSLEYERSSEGGGADIALAIKLGLIKSATEPRIAGLNWYMEPPALLPYTEEEYLAICGIPEFSRNPSELTFGWGELSNKIIDRGLLGAGYSSPSEVLKHIGLNWRAEEYLKIQSAVYQRLIIFYYEYQKGVEY